MVSPQLVMVNWCLSNVLKWQMMITPSPFDTYIVRGGYSGAQSKVEALRRRMEITAAGLRWVA